jgi:hypothetical protein
MKSTTLLEKRPAGEALGFLRDGPACGLGARGADTHHDADRPPGDLRGHRQSFFARRCSPTIATSPVKAVRPVPSTTVAPRMTMSCTDPLQPLIFSSIMHARPGASNARQHKVERGEAKRSTQCGYKNRLRGTCDVISSLFWRRKAPLFPRSEPRIEELDKRRRQCSPILQ